MKSAKIVIDGIETDYDIYTNGDVYSFKTNKFLKQHVVCGYLSVSLFLNGKNRMFKTHRLVATAFIPNPYNKPQVNHIDGNKLNPDVSNLEWVTASENVLHAFRTGLKQSKIGKYSHLAKYDESAVRDACEYMEEGLISLSEISKITGLSFGMLWLIVTKKSWVNVSCEYNIDNYYKERESYTDEMYENVFRMLEENKYSLYEISDITGVKYVAICNILSHKNNPLYDNLYDIYDISKYTGGYIPYKEISNFVKDEIVKLYQDGIKPKYIKRIISKSYNINEEKIRVYIRDHVR